MRRDVSHGPEEVGMRKRFGLLWTLVILSLAMMLPATTAASSLGSIQTLESWCKGTTVHVVFEVVKNANHYADTFTLKATGQGSNGGRWYNAGSKNYSYTIDDPWARAYFDKQLTFNSAYYAYSRIQGTARFYAGGSLVGTAKIASVYC
jgi:hypothetical protein